MAKFLEKSLHPKSDIGQKNGQSWISHITLSHICKTSAEGSAQREHDKRNIKPSPLIDQHHVHPCEDTGWYNLWVHQQIEKQPEELFSVMCDGEVKNETWVASFQVLWREVWVESQVPASSVDSIIRSLLQREILRQSDDPTSTSCARNLVFAIIGWQTMLYRPDMGSCNHGELAIADVTDGHCDHAHLCLRQSQSACKRPLCEFLKGFGVMLPCRNFSAVFSEEDKNAFRKCSSLSSSILNAHLLTKVGRIHIKWTDVLACHLELDRTTNTLYLFRYPSFCAVHLQTQNPKQSNATLHACAAPPGSVAHWATVDEINGLLQEVLLSLRLLFGQDKTSRKLFRETHPFDGTPEKCRDEVLMSLCGRKQCSPDYGLRERDIYDLQHDFPILRSRIAVLMNHFSNVRPRTWKELWDDKRDSASWHTFWLVLIIGGVGILLAFLQVVFQIVQTVLQIKQA